jgi:alpha-tubulin suppressor-like RCC1 family protein
MLGKHAWFSCLVAAWLGGGAQIVWGCGSGESGATSGTTDGGDASPDRTSSSGGADGAGGRGSSRDAEPFVACAATQVVAGSGHACALEADGTVWCWGSGTQGQLGNGTRTGSAFKPMKVASLGSDVEEIEAASNQTCAGKKDGTVWCWGSDYGATPVHVGGLDGAASFAVGDGHVCAVSNDGSVSCRGDSAYGQLGTGSTVGPAGAIAELGNDVSSVAAGSNHACAVKKDGTLWCWGSNANGQLGLGDGAPPFQCGTGNPCQPSPVQVSSLGATVKAVVAGGAMTCAIEKDGTSWCWGAGILGDGTTLNRDAPVQVGALGSDAAKLSTRGSHSCAVRSDGTLWCWGSNASGELGLGNNVGQFCYGTGGGCMPLPLVADVAGSDVTGVAVGSTFTCVLTQAGSVRCWGGNAGGQLGDGTNATPKLIPVDTRLCELGGGAGSGGRTGAGGAGGAAGSSDAGACTVEELVLSDQHTCVRKGDGSLWCWGANSHGELGTGKAGASSPSPVKTLTIGASFTTAGAGQDHTCALEANGSLWCWGYAPFGPLGGPSGNDACSCEPAPAQVGTLGYEVAGIGIGGGGGCAIKNDRSLWCWGSNRDGELGIGSTAETAGTAEVMALGKTTMEVVVGSSHACALKKDGTVWCWGSNNQCQLGDGTTQAPYCGGVNCSTLPRQVTALGTATTHLEASGNTTCALRKDGTLWCWGSNGGGQLGIGVAPPYGGPTPCGAPAAVATLGNTVTGVALGAVHACAVKMDGSLYCWGLADQGRLGTGTAGRENCGLASPCESSPVQVTALGKTVMQVEAGGAHTCARTADGVFCWGENTSGQVGDGTMATPKPTPTAVHGICP